MWSVLSMGIQPPPIRRAVDYGSVVHIERTHAWMNAYGKLRRCTQKHKVVVDFYPFLAAAFGTVRCLMHAARIRYRWPNGPTTRRIK